MTEIDAFGESGADGRAVVRLRGEIDISTVDRVIEEVRRLEEDAPALLVLDLSEVTFLDSTGLRMILEADTRARNEGRRLALVPGPPEIQRVFAITDLTTRLEFVDTGEDRDEGNRG